MNQVPRIGLAQYELDYGSVSAKCGSNPSSETQNDRTICGLLNVTLKGAQYVDNPFAQSGYSITSDNGNGVESGATGWHGYQLPDGSMFIFQEYDGNCTESTKCLGYIDVNGYTLPNKEVKGTSSSVLNAIIPLVHAGPRPCMDIDCPDGTPAIMPNEVMGVNCMCKCPDDYVLPGESCHKESAPAAQETEDQASDSVDAPSGFTDDDTVTNVPKDAEHMTDVYPVYIYGQVVVPATKAGEIVLKSAK